jgi:hypothetical protein
MSHLQQALLSWGQERLDQIEKAPRMWGTTDEAVEFQYLLLLELLVFIRQDTQDPRFVLEAYDRFLRQRFPERPSQPLHQLSPTLLRNSGEAMDILRAFRQRIEQEVSLREPFATRDLVLHLTYKPEVRPTASSLTDYVATFRQAARAAVRRPGIRVGRVSKDFEQATDFVLDDIDVQQPNGAPAEAWISLSRPPVVQTSLDLEERSQVELILGQFATLAEWSSRDEEDMKLPFQGPEQTMLAWQASRLVPRGPLERVDFGGRILQRYTPVSFRPRDAGRLMRVAASHLIPEPFDGTREIRAIDLDTGELRLEDGPRRRLLCYLPPELAGEFRQVGVQIRVVGHLYRPLAGSPFVLVREAELVPEDTPPDP